MQKRRVVTQYLIKDSDSNHSFFICPLPSYEYIKDVPLFAYTLMGYNDYVLITIFLNNIQLWR